MSNKKSKAIFDSRSERACPSCGSPMHWVVHKEITPKILRQAYYFFKWEKCTSCRKGFYNPSYLVKNDSGARISTLINTVIDGEAQLDFDFQRAIDG